MMPTYRKPTPSTRNAAVMRMFYRSPPTRKVVAMNRQKTPLPLVDLSKKMFSLMKFMLNSDRKIRPPKILEVNQH